MSEVMRSGVIRMPYEMAMRGEISRQQFYNRAQSVLNELEAAEKLIEQLEDDLTMLLKREREAFMEGYKEGYEAAKDEGGV